MIIKRYCKSLIITLIFLVLLIFNALNTINLFANPESASTSSGNPIDYENFISIAQKALQNGCKIIKKVNFYQNVSKKY